MRYLTIQRKRNIVGCVRALKVYIEDPQADDLEINGVRCRLLGALTNGKKTDFRVSEAAARVFVIDDEAKADGCDGYPLPAGPESVTISGRCVLCRGKGKAFRFDGLDPEGDRKRRRNMLLTAGIAALVVVAVCVAAAVMEATAKPAVSDPYTYFIDDLQITLTQDFSEFDAQGYERAFDSEHVALMILQEEFTLMEGLEDYTVIQYGELVLGNNQNTKNDGLQTKNGVLYFEYEKENAQDGEMYHYIVTMYKGPDAFWMIQYIVDAGEVNHYRDYIFEWAASVTFKQ